MCVDEKSQIQALDRRQPGLPLKKGRCGTMTHDYKRNGTATLFAALNVADGTVISMCDDRHRHQEWLQFLRVIDQVTFFSDLTQNRLRRVVFPRRRGIDHGYWRLHRPSQPESQAIHLDRQGE
jgi:hypothetical protein